MSQKGLLNVGTCGDQLTAQSGYGGGPVDISNSVIFNDEHTAAPCDIMCQMAKLNLGYENLRDSGVLNNARVDAIMNTVLSLWKDSTTDRESQITIMGWLRFWAIDNASGEMTTGLWRNPKLVEVMLRDLNPVYEKLGEPNNLGVLICEIIRLGCESAFALESMVAAETVEWLMDICMVEGIHNTYLVEIVYTLAAICSKSPEAQDRIFTKENMNCLAGISMIGGHSLQKAVCHLKRPLDERFEPSDNAAAGLGGK